MNQTKAIAKDMPIVLTIDELISSDEESLADLVGGKAMGLVRLVRDGGDRFNVPPFFVVTARANFADSDARHTLMAQVDNQLVRLQHLAGQTGKRPAYAVRSSCLLEDQKNESFAGQYDSFLQVDDKDVFARIESVMKGARNSNVNRYKKLLAIDNLQSEMAVVVQVMVEPDVAGVMFSVNPVSGEADAVVINAVDGLADELVQGLVDGHHIVVKGNQITGGGTSKIDHEIIFELANQARDLEKLCGFAVDVEWAVRDQTIYILQVRPVTTTTASPGERGNNIGPDCLRVFDGSNIQESYPGITSPMTFSFVRRAYREVYRSFVRLMGVSDEVIGRNEDIFASMLGFIEGHIYYNLGSWYRLLALLPAYKTNRGFMEKMMGLKEPALAVSPAGQDSPPGIKEKAATAIALGHIGLEYLKLERSKASFYQRLDTALNIDRASLKTMDMDSLCRLYRRLEMDLLTRWDAPIVNDFFAMIFFGIYQKLNSDQASYHSLIEGLGNVVSARPPEMIKEIAELIKGDSTLLTAILQDPEGTNVEKLFQSHREAYALYQRYLLEFGDRSIGELKLESQSVRENPNLLLLTIATVARARAMQPRVQLSLVVGDAQESHMSKNITPLPDAGPALKSSPFKKLLLPLISNRTRDLIAGRENLRFARTKVFGLVRDIMLSLADKLVHSNLLDCRQDIFYLEIEEVLGFVEGGSTCKNLKALVALRKTEERTYMPVIPDRIACLGATGLWSMPVPPEGLGLHQPTSLTATAESGGCRINGLPACSGKVVGLARVIKDPAREHLLPGEILVAERTDPGWIMHFALCHGIVTSYGSMLSHTAIVARELKIPAVVAAKGATEMIGSGDLIEVDGGSGLVTILKRAAHSFSITPAEKECA